MDKKTYLRNPDVALRDEDDDGALLFNPDTNQVLVLNPTALCVWNHCDGSSDLPSLIGAVKDRFAEVPEETVCRDIERFIEDMAAGGYLCLAEN